MVFRHDYWIAYTASDGKKKKNRKYNTYNNFGLEYHYLINKKYNAALTRLGLSASENPVGVQHMVRSFIILVN